MRLASPRQREGQQSARDPDPPLSPSETSPRMGHLRHRPCGEAQEPCDVLGVSRAEHQIIVRPFL